MNANSEFLRQSSLRFTRSFDRITHAIRQLTDQQIWQRPSKMSNSIGIILQHLSGNLNQWVCAAIGGDQYQRKRSAEFTSESQSSKEHTLLAISQLANRIQEIIIHIPSESLLDSKRIQGFDENVLSAIYAASTHLELHAGQIVYIAKLLLDDKYIEHWRPANPEQGMP
jgi:hypothetical protein